MVIAFDYDNYNQILNSLNKIRKDQDKVKQKLVNLKELAKDEFFDKQSSKSGSNSLLGRVEHLSQEQKYANYKLNLTLFFASLGLVPMCVDLNSYLNKKLEETIQIVLAQNPTWTRNDALNHIFPVRD